MNAGTLNRTPINVLIAAGEYQLKDSLVFLPEDSGTADAPVTYSAITPGSVKISGGVPLARRTTGDANVATFEAPVGSVGQWAGGGQLYVDSKRATLARQPNAGAFWFVKKQVALPTEPIGQQGAEAFGTFADAQTWLGTLSATDKARAIINVMHSWTTAQGRFSSAVVPADALAVQPRALWPYLKFGTSQRFYLENIAAAFDSPGEWLWDANGVRYLPTTGQSAASVTAVMPMLERLVVVKGNLSTNQLVEHLRFYGLTFAHTRSEVPAGGQNDTQAALNTSAAIEVDGARFLSIDNCAVVQTGGYGIWFRRAVRSSTVSNSTLTDLGAGGLRLGQALQSTTDTIQTGANSAIGNRISETGKVYAGGVGIWLGQGFDNLVANNAIFNTTYSGISVGWTWGYAPATSGRNVISNNLLYGIGQGVLDDLGAIYTLGISQGTVIRENVIREVRGYPGYGVGAWGIYNDAGSSGIIVENNLVVGTDNGAYHLNYGRQNIVRTNLFAIGKKSEFTVTHSDPTATKLAVDGNILIPNYSKPFVGFAQAPDVNFRGNAVSPVLTGSALDVSKCGTGCTLQQFNVSTTASPRGISVTGTSATYAAKVAAIAASAGPIEVSTAPEQPVPDTPPPAPLAPPMGFNTNFSTATLGTQPVGLQYFPKGDLAAISLVSDPTAPGGRCLQFNDSASMPARYFPFVFAALNHDAGTTVAEFSLRIDANSNFFHEWRDNAIAYLVGPSLRISPLGVIVKGKVIAAVGVGEWLNVKVSAPLAVDSGTWTLELRRANGETTTVPGLAFGSVGWKRLNWLGFVSDAGVASSMCLGNVTATSSVQ